MHKPIIRNNDPAPNDEIKTDIHWFPNKKKRLDNHRKSDLENVRTILDQLLMFDYKTNIHHMPKKEIEKGTNNQSAKVMIKGKDNVIS